MDSQLRFQHDVGNPLFYTNIDRLISQQNPDTNRLWPFMKRISQLWRSCKLWERERGREEIYLFTSFSIPLFAFPKTSQVIVVEAKVMHKDMSWVHILRWTHPFSLSVQVFLWLKQLSVILPKLLTRRKFKPSSFSVTFFLAWYTTATTVTYHLSSLSTSTVSQSTMADKPQEADDWKVRP